MAGRIIGHLVVAQLAAFVIAGAVEIAFELGNVAFFRMTLDEMASYRVGTLVVHSLVIDREGEVRIEPDAALRAEMRRTPALKFAVFDQKRRPAPGSSPELVSALVDTRVIQMTQAHLHFNLPDDVESTPLGYLERRWTRFGWRHVAIYRQGFLWVDFFWKLFEDMQWGVIGIVFVTIASVGTAWYAVRKGLAPLRAAAREVGGIDLDSVGRGVHIEQVPAEIRPFVDAIDAALVRVAASAARMRRFTANAAHELRTPLAVMRARIENAAASPLRSDLLDDSSHLQTLVEQMLVTIRLSENRALRDESIDLAKAVRGVVAGFVLLAVQRGRSLAFEEGEADIVVRGNRRAIECVVSNLVDNALRAEPVGGTVLVRVGADASVTVADHGEGVASADRERIFEPFWRKSEETSGSGLGLAIARELMESIGGRIEVEDTPGGGATFALSFLAESAGAPEPR
nr:HAMP domain-containing sensor histidine kinase [Methylosinus sp. Sm6]